MTNDDQTSITLGHALADALVAHGAREVFGLPGDFALPLFSALSAHGGLPLHRLLHEPAVAFAADAAARMRSGIGVALVTWGAGALNMVNAVANAYAERSPVVVISGAPGLAERRRGLRLHHQVKSLDSQRLVYREVTCDHAVLDSAERAPLEIARVLRSAREHSRPVYLEVPRDVVGHPCARVTPLAPTPWDAAAALACADEILARLATALRPVILVDIEVRRFGLEDKVAELARRLRLPVVTTFLGAGLMAAHPELVRGVYLGAAGEAAITALVEDADVVLGLGLIPSDVNLGIAVNALDWRRIIDATERSVRIAYHAYDNLPLAALIDALLLRTTGTPAPAPAPAPPPAPALTHPATPSASSGVTPHDLVVALDELRRRAPYPLAVDVGDALFAAVDLAPGPLVASAYYATMGMAIPATLGIQTATGQRPIALVGDGAFYMTGAELALATHPGWDPIVVVMNNAEWTMLRALDGGPSPHYALPCLDFAALARALGGDGFTVTHRAELDAALARAHETRGRFQLLDVRLAPGSLSPRLSRFAAALAHARDRGRTPAAAAPDRADRPAPTVGSTYTSPHP